MNYTAHSEQELIEIGTKLAENLHGGHILLLHGDLGAGKTTLTKGIAQGLGITDEITSPTFTLMNMYNLRTKKSELRTLVHIDTYRLESEEQLIEIGVEDYLGDKDTICVIEWPEKIEKKLQDKKVKHILIEHTKEGRMVKIEN